MVFISGGRGCGQARFPWPRTKNTPFSKVFIALKTYVQDKQPVSPNFISQQIKKEGLVSVELTGLAWSATLYKCLERDKYCATVVTYLESRF